MNREKWLVRSIVAVALLALAMPTRAKAASPPPVVGQAVRRVAANFTAFDGSQISLFGFDAAGGGLEIYDQTVKTPPGAQVMYVTIDATAATTFLDSVGVALNCVVDGVNCNPGFGDDQDLDELPPGWIDVTGKATTHGTAGTSFSTIMPVAYTWCVPINRTDKNLHTVELFAGQDEDEVGDFVVLQTVSFYVDVSRFSRANKNLGNACAGVPNVNPTDVL